MLWSILVGAVTWESWPPTYLSVDPHAGIPLPKVGSDVTLLMDGVLKADEKIPPSEFAARLKRKYPEYGDLTDDELVSKGRSGSRHSRLAFRIQLSGGRPTSRVARAATIRPI